MSKTTKLKVSLPWYPFEETYDLEQAKYLLFSSPGPVIAVEGQVIYSYEELLRLVSQERHKDKTSLKVNLYTSAICGG